LSGERGHGNLQQTGAQHFNPLGFLVENKQDFSESHEVVVRLGGEIEEELVEEVLVHGERVIGLILGA
jgi:hypothetical protein